tara:strand:+ start:634 stop:1506 length:873 start_codon:yes stop_codon:yes gene_type:complete
VPEDTSPENLRKFLESDDPALVRMGLSMVKGVGVPEDLLPTILGLYMWNDNKKVRTAAKLAFNNYSPTEIKAKVKENWKPSYRTLNRYKDTFKEKILPFLEAFKAQDHFALIAFKPLIKILEGEWDESLSASNMYSSSGVSPNQAARALGNIGDKRAVEPLIKALRDWEHELTNIMTPQGQAFGSVAANALGNIGDKRAVEPLIKALENNDKTFGFDLYRRSAANALGWIGDKRAVEPLLKIIEDYDLNKNIQSTKEFGSTIIICEIAAGALKKLGHGNTNAVKRHLWVE